jgi:hypothetical protein
MSIVDNRDEPDQSGLAAASMAWSGWGSPVGIGILIVSVGLGLFLIRLAIMGL